MIDLFSAAQLARDLRDAGIARVKCNNESWVERARGIALSFAQINGTVTADIVRALIEPPEHPNAWGAIFRHKNLRWTGKMRASATASRHAGLQRVWEWVDS